MTKSELEKQLKDLKNIAPNADFCSSSREKMVALAASMRPVMKVNNVSYSKGLSWLRPASVLAVAVLVIVVGSEMLLAPTQSSKTKVAEVSYYVKNEWQLADISPYLNEIFKEDGNKSVALNGGQNSVAMAEQAKTEPSRKPALTIRKEEYRENSIPNLGMTEVDRTIDSLTF